MPPELAIILSYFWQLVKAWWWLPLPFFLWKYFLYLWKWWRTEIWFKTVYKPILLEIKLPREVVKPIRAMENVLAAIHGAVYHPPDRWERYIDGQVQTGLSFDIVSIEGEIHFYIRFHQDYRQAVEAAIYSQYPEAEITQVEDYIKFAPHDIPNKDWDLFASDYQLAKPKPYPIKTYRQFETEQEREPEKIVDPLANLLEGLAKMKPGEQFWIQIMATPLGTAGEPGAPRGTVAGFLKKGEEIINKITKRKTYKPKPMIKEAAEILIPRPEEIAGVISGAKPEGWSPAQPPKEEELFPPVRMKLTPVEEEILKAVETKISKPAFGCGIRFIYLGKRDVFFKPNLRIAFNFFNCYTTVNMNALIPWGATITKIKKSIWFPPLNWIRPRRHYLRCRRIYRHYRERLNTLFPRFGADQGTFVLNTEELASLYHFPSWEVAPVPGVPRVEAKKGPPPTLPIAP